VVAVAGGWDAGQEFLRSDGTVVYGSPGLRNVAKVARGHFFGIAIVVPVEPASALAIQPEDPAWKAGRFCVSARTRFGRVYVLQYRSALYFGGWVPLRLVSGNGDMQVLRDDGASTPHRFYRLIEW